MLRQDLNNETKNDVLFYQTNVMDTLGVLQHHDAITGTSKRHVAGDFNEKAKLGRIHVNEMNSKFLKEKLEHDFPIEINQMDSDMVYRETHNNLTSPYSHYNETMFTI